MQPTLTIYFDGLCPLCAREIAHYRKRTADDPLVVYTDITAAEFDAAREGLDTTKIHRVMHVKDGETLHTGLDAFIAIWRRVRGFGWLARLANVPGVYQMMRVGYACFARLRPLLPRRKAACSEGVCQR